MSRAFKEELSTIEGLTMYGPPKGHLCTSTISFRIKDLHPLEVAKELAKKGIFVWAGGFYAVPLMKLFGVYDRGGLVRIGLAPYNTKQEIERTLSEIRSIAK
jgi:selenocysteine lyase/cysteine desulfurase